MERDKERKMSRENYVQYNRFKNTVFVFFSSSHHDEGVGYVDFNSPGPFIWVIHTSSSFHPFTSFLPPSLVLFPPCSDYVSQTECLFHFTLSFFEVNSNVET
jgi:hypothetical protein